MSISLWNFLNLCFALLSFILPFQLTLSLILSVLIEYITKTNDRWANRKERQNNARGKTDMPCPCSLCVFFFFCLMAFTEYTHTSIEVQITHIYRYKHTFICHFQNAQSSYNMTQAHKLLLFLFLSDILVLPAKKCYLKSQLKRCLSKIIISNACILLYNSTHGLSTKIGEKMLPWGWE